MPVDPSIMAAAKRYFNGVKCLDGKFTVVVPRYTKNPKFRGCPGGLDLCRTKQLPEDKQRRICDGAVEGTARLMAKTFGPGNTTVKDIGEWRDPKTKEVFREAGVQISTRFRNSCLIPKKNDQFMRTLNRIMINACQTQVFIEDEKGAALINTGQLRKPRVRR